MSSKKRVGEKIPYLRYPFGRAIASLTGTVAASTLALGAWALGYGPWQLAVAAPVLGVLFTRRVAAGKSHKCAADRRSLAGKTAIITGANSGIGKETAVVLAQRGAEVFLACRSKERGMAAEAEIRKRSNSANVHFRQLDLSDLASVRSFVADWEGTIDILVNNAGVMRPPLQQTKQGVELQFGVNHLGHFLLTTSLLDNLADKARVITLTSLAHHRSAGVRDWASKVANVTGDEYDPGIAYGDSKLANVLFASELQRRLEARGSSAISMSVHPGGVYTDLGRHVSGNPLVAIVGNIIGPLILKMPSQGAQTSLHCALGDSASLAKGGYHANCSKGPTSDEGKDPDLAKALWKQTEEIIASLKF